MDITVFFLPNLSERIGAMKMAIIGARYRHNPLVNISFVFKPQKKESKYMANAASIPPAKAARRPEKNRNI